MTQRDEINQQGVESEARSANPRHDDRRGDVKPTDNPVPRSPEADEAAVREGKEKLKRVKPY